ncbi:hypothetical protein G6F43_004005 [Rhizopus delemar]|nr:hypothetical protein G6F43_004005 [Rhizopus delemar]
MEPISHNKRRASESEASEALALISGQQITRIPPPLPYLPSDYQPSPDSPRRTVVLSKRQRSLSTGHYLTIEHEPSSSDSFELVPYREWTVISQNSTKGQVVLYNQDSQSVTVQRFSPENTFASEATASSATLSPEVEKCPYCHRPLEKRGNAPEYMDQNYFRLLASSTTTTANNSPIQSRSSTFSPDPHRLDPSSINLNENAFNQGYYSKFFVELKKLGKGFRGSVFLCEIQHMLDGVKLGKYAVKKVAIGNNHTWLVRMLREVHLLERLRHPNIVTYKHSWLEFCQLSPFGPEVPCLFILMECANGGNLEEYFEPLVTPVPPPSTTKTRKESKRERIKRQLREQDVFEQEESTLAGKRLLTMTEIGSLFLDIVQGLAHLHQHNIVHRDLKPPNLLLHPRVLISDFGECEDLDGEDEIPRNNRTGATGTLEFMAPEHVQLDARGRNTVDYSPKADMWSLGMVLYYLCYSRLPYSNIDDVDILRQEILSFQEVNFPKSRLDMYKQENPLYLEALNNPEIDSDVPNELKLLIRLLLSVDPSKRPSCNEILVKIRERTSMFHWNNTPSPSDTPSAESESSRVIVEEPGDLKKRSSTDNHHSPANEEEESNTRKRYKVDSDQEPDLPVGLLLSSSNPPRRVLNDKQYAKALKSITAALKIASCTYPCSPYVTKPVILYPVVFLATLDFWHESNSPSLILLILHVVWILFTTIFTTGGLCQA